nr:methylated-DNA--[protein]-cysteine S-methyltransferase [Candidatus Cloacimonadota bacterium]
MKLYKSQVNTSFGKINLIFNKNGLLNVSFKSYPGKWINNHFPDSDIQISNENIYLTQIKEYFCGVRRKFGFPVVFIGTNFQKDVWKFVYNIPFSKPMSYSELAKEIHKKSAQRAVGHALRENHLLLVVPCHRVIKSNGNLGGFS